MHRKQLLNAVPSYIQEIEIQLLQYNRMSMPTSVNINKRSDTLHRYQNSGKEVGKGKAERPGQIFCKRILSEHIILQNLIQLFCLYIYVWDFLVGRGAL